MEYHRTLNGNELGELSGRIVWVLSLCSLIVDGTGDGGNGDLGSELVAESRSRAGLVEDRIINWTGPRDDIAISPCSKGKDGSRKAKL